MAYACGFTRTRVMGSDCNAASVGSHHTLVKVMADGACDWTFSKVCWKMLTTFLGAWRNCTDEHTSCSLIGKRLERLRKCKCTRFGQGSPRSFAWLLACKLQLSCLDLFANCLELAKLEQPSPNKSTPRCCSSDVKVSSHSSCTGGAVSILLGKDNGVD